LHLYDPFKGFPDIEKDGKRHYFSRTGLPDLHTLLSIKDLESVEILSITSYLLVLNHIDDIDDALGKEVKITFILLDPEDTEHVEAQSQNYRNRDIRKQIETTIKELSSLSGNITILTYRKMIGRGIIILKIKNNDNPWIKVEKYPGSTDANSRYNMAWNRKDSPEDFDKNHRDLNKIIQESKSI
jgi:uncharacterized protein (UPF0216 family)